MLKAFKIQIEKLSFIYENSKIIVTVIFHDVALDIYTENLSNEDIPETQEDFIEKCKQIFNDKVPDCWKYGK